MLTGVPHPQANAKSATDIRPTPNDHPHLGSLLAKVRPPRDGVPAFASLPEVIKDAAVNEFPGQGAGFLGAAYDPFRIQRRAAASRRVSTARHLPAAGRDGRPPGRPPAAAEPARPRAGGSGAQPAHGRPRRLLRAGLSPDRLPRCPRAPFSSTASRRRCGDAYGQHLFGQGCLLARRLLEAGVGLVTVYWHYEGPDDSPVWDTHWNNFRTCATG